jgi:hypothetical protein
MTRNQKHPRQLVRNPAYRQAFERLDEALEENTPCDNREKIAAMRKALFADVDEFLASGEFQMPKRPN